MSHKEEPATEFGREVKLIFGESPQPSAYATNMTVQHTPHEFVISFYEARPPMVMGTFEERMQQVQAMEEISAPCVARITVAASRMGKFVKAFQDNYETYRKACLAEGAGNE